MYSEASRNSSNFEFTNQPPAYQRMLQAKIRQLEQFNTQLSHKNQQHVERVRQKWKKYSSLQKKLKFLKRQAEINQIQESQLVYLETQRRPKTNFSFSPTDYLDSEIAKLQRKFEQTLCKSKHLVGEEKISCRIELSSIASQIRQLKQKAKVCIS